MPMRSIPCAARPITWAGLVLLLSCGGSSASPAAPAAGGAPDDSRRAALKGAEVFDADGRPIACVQPRNDCPDVPPDTPFLDRCRLGGYQVRKCGCASLCSGDVSAAKRYFDPAGNGKDCEPARTDCDAPPASTAFQDACNDRGFKLAQCGCEWLCSGNTAK